MVAHKSLCYTISNLFCSSNDLIIWTNMTNIRSDSPFIPHLIDYRYADVEY